MFRRRPGQGLQEASSTKRWSMSPCWWTDLRRAMRHLSYPPMSKGYLWTIYCSLRIAFVNSRVNIHHFGLWILPTPEWINPEKLQIPYKSGTPMLAGCVKDDQVDQTTYCTYTTHSRFRKVPCWHSAQLSSFHLNTCYMSSWIFWCKRTVGSEEVTRKDSSRQAALVSIKTHFIQVSDATGRSWKCKKLHISW